MNRFKSFALVITALAMMVGWPTPASAQSLYGSIVGQVADPSGAAIVQATGTLTNKATGQIYEAKADENGRLSIPNILPATTI